MLKINLVEYTTLMQHFVAKISVHISTLHKILKSGANVVLH